MIQIVVAALLLGNALETAQLHAQEKDDTDRKSSLARNLQSVPREFAPVFKAICDGDYAGFLSKCGPHLRVTSISVLTDSMRTPERVPYVDETTSAYQYASSVIDSRKSKSRRIAYVAALIGDLRDGFAAVEPGSRQLRPKRGHLALTGREFYGYSFKSGSSSYIYLVLNPTDKKHPVREIISEGKA